MKTLRYFYHSDHLGSTSWVTDSAKNGVQYCEYLPYGEPFIDQRSTTWSSRYTFSGKERDSETGYSYFGARYYHSDLSIWLSVDPMSDKYPNLTPYAYCANNPVILVDPDGRQITPPPRRVLITVSGTPNGNYYSAKTYPDRSNNCYTVPVYNITISGNNNDNKEVSQTWQILRFMPFLNENSQRSGYGTETGKIPIMAGLADGRECPIQNYLPDYEIHNTYSEENGGFVIYGNFMIHDGPDDLNTESCEWGGAGCMEVVGENGFSEMKKFIFSLSGSKKQDMDEGLNDLVKSGNLILKLEPAQRPKVKAVND